jgi:ferritin-like metal-binding protein YciE
VPDLNNLQDLFEEEMQGIYDAEKQVLQMLAHMIEAVLDEQLRDALSAHLAETHVHIERLEDAFHLMGLTPRRRRSAGMAGIVDEGSELLLNVFSPEPVRDAAFIASCQRVEHYEIAGYGTLIAWAKLLRQHELVNLFKATEHEEMAADARLSTLAEARINEAARHPFAEVKSSSRNRSSRPGRSASLR